MLPKKSQIIEYIELFNSDLKVIESISLSNFRYKERIQLERMLYFILNTLLESDTEGFNHASYQKIKISLTKKDTIQENIVDRIFEMHIFLKSISSNNPYVRDDALIKADTNRLDVFKMIRVKMNRIKGLVNSID
jgi:hypothetical protein